MYLYISIYLDHEDILPILGTCMHLMMHQSGNLLNVLPQNSMPTGNNTGVDLYLALPRR